MSDAAPPTGHWIHYCVLGGAATLAVILVILNAGITVERQGEAQQIAGANPPGSTVANRQGDQAGHVASNATDREVDELEIKGLVGEFARTNVDVIATLNSTKPLPDGEECHTEKHDKNDGTFEEVRKCKPKTRSEVLTGSDRSQTALAKFTASLIQRGGMSPDVLALVDKGGNLIALHDVNNPDRQQWNEAWHGVWPSLVPALVRGDVVSGGYTYGGTAMLFVVAPVLAAPRDDPPPPPSDNKPHDGKEQSGGTGTAMTLDEGKMGKKDSNRAEGQYKMQKTQDDPQLAREQAIEQARNAGILGSTAMSQGGAFASTTFVGAIVVGYYTKQKFLRPLGPAGEMKGGVGYGSGDFGPNGNLRLQPDEGQLAIEVPPGVKAGTEMIAKIVVTPSKTYRINTEFPTKLTLESFDGLTIAKKQLTSGGQDKTKGDARVFDESNLTFAAKLTFLKGGSYTINGSLKFAVCDRTGNTCLAKKEPIAIHVAVSSDGNATGPTPCEPGPGCD